MNNNIKNIVNTISIRYIIGILIISSLIMCTLSGCDDKDKTKEKVGQEVKFMENKIVSMLNSLNNIKFTNYVLVEKNLESQKAEGEKSDTEQGSGGSQKMGGESEQSQEEGGSSGGSSSEGNSGGGSSSGGSSGSSSVEGSDTNSSGIQYEMQEKGILSNDESVDWNSTKNEVENLYSIWSSIIVDLHSVNVNNEDILNFSNQLDDLIVEVQKEDKINITAMLANLYSYMPRYVEHYTDDSIQINLSYAKSYIISSYAYIEQDNWNEAKLRTTKAQEYFSNIINNVNEKNVENQNKYSKVYVLMGEFNNSVDKRDKQLYYIKYRKLMEEIEGLENNNE